MRNRLFLFLAFLLLMRSGLRSFEKVSLELFQSFPLRNQNVFFKTIPFIAVDTEGNIYAVENRYHVIYKFCQDSEKVIKIGGPGQGPGELQYPWLITVGSNRIFVIDNIGVSIFQDDGSFLNRFRLFYPSLSISYMNGEVLLAEIRQDSLITVYDQMGKRIRSFGEKYRVDYSLYNGWPANFIDRIINSGRIIVTPNHIYYFTYLFGDLLKYDREGRLICQKRPIEDDEVYRNLDFYFKKGQKRGRSNEFFHNYLFADATYFEGHFYLLIPKRKLKDRPGDILKISEKSLKIEKSFLLDIEGAEVRTLTNLSLIKKDSEILFAISLYDQKLEDIKINIYKEEAR